MFFRAMATAVAAGALALTGVAVAQAAPVSDVPLTGPLTGPQLESALLPASYFGAGYKYAPNNPWDSGSGLERPAVKVHLSSYSCKQFLQNQMPFSGYGETAFAGGQVFKGKITDWTGSYYQEVYQFPTAIAATSFYQENYTIIKRCEKVSVTTRGKTESLTVQSLTTGAAGGNPAFFDLATVGYTGFPNDYNNDEWVLAGRDVYNVDGFYPVGRPRLTPKAATLALIARVEAAG